MHGNIVAVLAGTPSILFPIDPRMRELTEYHNLTHVWHNETIEDTSLEDLIEKSDFQSTIKTQERNFDHYIDFLNKKPVFSL